MVFPIRVPALLSVSAVAVLLLCAQDPVSPTPQESSRDRHLPNGRLQRDEILKADYTKNLDDTRELVRLSQELQKDLEKNTEFVYSIPTVKKVEQIEKLARRIRTRLKRL